MTKTVEMKDKYTVITKIMSTHVCESMNISFTLGNDIYMIPDTMETRELLKKMVMTINY
jgi:hypothetical protein